MTQKSPATPLTDGALLDATQYQPDAIEKYEAIYGKHFISPGGIESARRCIALLDLRPGMRVLDVGCGLGGSAFLMAKEKEVQVDGIDISANMLGEAQRRLQGEGLQSRVRLFQQDVMLLPAEPIYDAVYSRDVFLHIHDKTALLAHLVELLRPGGVLFFTDYCRGEGKPSESFARYIEQRQYDLRTVAQYQQLLEQAGFVEASATDHSQEFVEILQHELARIGEDADQVEIRQSWLEKIARAQRGEQGWCWCRARRP